MIYEMNNKDYYKVRYLLDNVENFPEIHAVINEINPGKIYVYEKDQPKSALVWNQGMQGFYFIGDVNNGRFMRSIKQYINDEIISELRSKEINWFEISGVNGRWDEKIEEMFIDENIQFGYQFIYSLDKNKVSYKEDAIHGYNIKKVDQGIFESRLDNLDFIKDELELFWGNMENFFEHGICYYVIEDNKIVSICYSGFKAEKTQTIGIETLKEYRRKGFAYALASKFVEDCLKQNIIPYWDCSEDNIGSKILAEKLGFEKNGQYRCYWFNF